MRVVKINAVWCSGCLVMNKVWKRVLDKYSIDTVNLDIDMDEEEVLKYNVGDILPVFIFFNGDKEIRRVIGEVSFDDMCKIIDEVLDEENS